MDGSPKHGSLADLSALARKYDRPGPRYTSYPTAVDFAGGFGEPEYLARLDAAARRESDDWSVYLHVPFCRQRCTFCACSVVVSPDPARVVEPYLARLQKEIAMVGARLGGRRGVAQLHLGGGTPTYLSPGDLRRVLGGLRAQFELRPGAEVSVEVDPRVTTLAHLEVLRELGFNRISLGVQDFDDEVQALIGRHQSDPTTAATLVMARDLGFESVNVDLVYGLPGQTARGFAATLARVKELVPDRIALYGYAHVPWSRGNQRSIDESTLPDRDLRLALWSHAREQLDGHGYECVGMDHFARPGDALAVASRQGTLRRNFMGYGVRAGEDLLGFGLTAIGDVDGAFVAGERKLVRYYRALDEGRLPVERGLRLSEDDRIRRRVIADLMCLHRIDKGAVEQAFGIEFDDYFAPDLRELDELEADGLVRRSTESVEVTPAGNVFVRNVAMCFDARLRSRRRLRLPLAQGERASAGLRDGGPPSREPNLFSRTI